MVTFPVGVEGVEGSGDSTMGSGAAFDWDSWTADLIGLSSGGAVGVGSGVGAGLSGVGDSAAGVGVGEGCGVGVGWGSGVVAGATSIGPDKEMATVWSTS